MSAPGSLPGIDAPTLASPDQLTPEAQLGQLAATTAQQHLAALTDYLREGLLLLDADLNVVLANDQFCRLLGLPLPASQWLGVPMHHLRELMR
jgi:PAS domain-containing protein